MSVCLCVSVSVCGGGGEGASQEPTGDVMEHWPYWAHLSDRTAWAHLSDRMGWDRIKIYLYMEPQWGLNKVTAFKSAFSF